MTRVASTSTPLILLALLTSACSGSEPSMEVAGGSTCTSRDGGSRWSGGEYAVTASFRGTPEQPLWEIAGVAAADSQVYVYDAPNSRVVVLDPHLRPRGAFGREGRGPGEFLSYQSSGKMGENFRWIDAGNGEVAVFSGDRVQILAPDGRHLREAGRHDMEAGDLFPFTARIRYAHGELFFSTETHAYTISADPADRGRTSVIRSAKRRSEPALTLAVAPLPTGRSNAPIMGPEQARPLWDVYGGCVAATESAQGRIVVRSLDAGARADTLLFALPDLPRPTVDREEYARLLAMASRGGAPADLKPTAPRRIDGMVIDPDGYAWVLPYQDPEHLDDAVEVVRVALATGAVHRDTVPGFPAEFGEPGVYYARRNDSRSGEAVLVRIERRSGS